jgi:uncharacterized membrane protein YfcA
VVQYRSQGFHRLFSRNILTALCTVGSLFAFGTAPAGDLDAPTPSAFLPGGMLGMQLGSSWDIRKRPPQSQTQVFVSLFSAASIAGVRQPLRTPQK